MASAQPRSFAELLRYYRVAARLTQEELAERSGLSARAVCALETGERRTPHKATVALLAKALELSATQEAHLLAVARPRFTPSLPSSGRASARPGRVFSTHPLDVPDVPLVGRQQEMRALTRHLAPESALLLLVTGEPGIGKSRLLAEYARQAVELGWIVMGGTCHRRSMNEPYEPFISALMRIISTRSDAQRRMDLHGCAWLVRLLPELVDTAIGPAPSWVLPPEQERRLMFGAVRRFFANIAQPMGLLLLLDDMQWAGQDTLDLLTYLLHDPAQPYLRVIASARDTDIPPNDSLSLLMSDLKRHGLATHLPLPPLADEDARDLLIALVGDAREDIHRQQHIATALERADGLPLFLVSFAQELRDGISRTKNTGAIGPPAEPVMPWSATESIRERIVVLPESAQHVLAVAAVAGRAIARQVLVAATIPFAHDESVVLSGLDAACRARLLEETSAGGYTFSHDLIRQVMDGEISSARRAALHRYIAMAMEQLPSTDDLATMLAWHWREGDEPMRALPYLVRAGDHASALYAHADADRHYSEALVLARLCGKAEVEAAALERRAEVRYRLGQFAEAATDLDAAAGKYEQLGDWEGLVWATAQWAKASDPLGLTAESLTRVTSLATLLAHMAAAHEGKHSARGADTDTLQERMRQAATLLTPVAAARLYLCLTSRMVFLGRLDDVDWASAEAETYAARAATALAAEAHAQASTHGRLLGLARPLVIRSLVLSFRAVALESRGLWQEAAATLEHATRLARESHDIDARGMALMTLAEVLEHTGSVAQARALLIEMLEIARECEDVRYIADIESRLEERTRPEGDARYAMNQPSADAALEHRAPGMCAQERVTEVCHEDS